MAVRLIRGVALIVQNPKGEILILQEYESKPYFGKYRGMFSIPMETSKPDESDIRAVARLIEEELPGFGFPLEEIVPAHIGIYRIVPHVWVNLYSVRAATVQLPSNNSESMEVGNYQWMRPENALNLWLRQGAREMIEDFVNNKKGMLCRRCRIPEEK